MLSPAIPRRCGQQLLDSESTRIRTGFFANERDNRHHKNVAAQHPATPNVNSFYSNCSGLQLLYLEHYSPK
jgi:hypothetical protein